MSRGWVAFFLLLLLDVVCLFCFYTFYSFIPNGISPKVPQGSILSPVLFSLKIDNIVMSVLKGSEASLFVDDFALFMCKVPPTCTETYAALCKQCTGMGL